MPRALTAEDIRSFREELCRVATRLFAEQGFEGVTLRALAGELGCSPMTPYRYFENKAEIFQAVRLEGFDRFASYVEEAAATQDAPLPRLRALFRAYVRFALDEPHAYRIMFQLDPAEDAAAPDPYSPAVQRTWLPLLRTLTELCEGGVLRGDPLTLAHVCWTQAHGLVTLHLAGRLQFDRDLEALVDPILEIFLCGTFVRPPRARA